MDQVQVYSNERVEGIKSVSISGYGVDNITTILERKFNNL